MEVIYHIGDNTTREDAKRIAQEFGDWLQKVVSKGHHEFDYAYSFGLILVNEQLNTLLDYCDRLKRENISFFFVLDNEGFLGDFPSFYLVTEPKFVKICKEIAELVESNLKILDDAEIIRKLHEQWGENKEILKYVEAKVARLRREYRMLLYDCAKYGAWRDYEKIEETINEFRQWLNRYIGEDENIKMILRIMALQSL